MTRGALLMSRGWLLKNLVKFDHHVLKAFNPAYCFTWFTRKGEDGWRSLGAILLCFTGVEALYADLGAFSSRSSPRRIRFLGGS